MNTLFRDRHDAGKFLAGKLKHLAGDPRVVVLGLPRGGVPVAYEIALALKAPLDIFIVRKLPVPVYEELAMGAIASGGVRALNEEIIHRLGINKRMIGTKSLHRRPMKRSVICSNGAAFADNWRYVLTAT
jgi:predicted phosphoribosyltransferase